MENFNNNIFKYTATSFENSKRNCLKNKHIN